MVYVTLSAMAAAELLGLLVGWLIFKITSRWFPPLHAILRYIDEASRSPNLLAAHRARARL